MDFKTRIKLLGYLTCQEDDCLVVISQRKIDGASRKIYSIGDVFHIREKDGHITLNTDATPLQAERVCELLITKLAEKPITELCKAYEKAVKND